MYRQGHYGVVLLVWAPIGGLIAVGWKPEVALVGLLIMLGVEQLPDYDMRTKHLKHRGFTHSIVFAALIGATTGAIGFGVASADISEQFLQEIGLEEPPLLASPLLCGLASSAFGALGILSHFAGDLITPSGIPLLWPYTSRRYSLDLVLAKDTAANYLLLAAGITVSYLVVDLSTEIGLLF